MRGRVSWPVPEPEIPEGTHPGLAAAARAAARTYGDARAAHDRRSLAEEVFQGADGTATMRVDELVESAVADSAKRSGLNLLSEEIGFIDNGSARTLVIDPVDGSANAAAGVPLSCVAGVIATDGVAEEALTVWLDTGRCWRAVSGEPTPYRTSGRTGLDGAAVNMLRPKATTRDSWWRISERASRIRVLSTTCLEAVLVAEGSIDAFADPGGEVHRIVDLAAAMVTLPAAGGAVIDAHGRPLELALDLTRRWSGVIAATRELAEEIAAEIGTDNGE